MNRMAELSASTDIPALAELIALRQWVCWRAVQRDGKMTKVPVQPSGINASTTNPHTWSTFEACQAAVGRNDIKGVGFVFTRATGIVGVDIDKCRNPETGEIDAEALAIVKDLRSYTELSQSGCGLHILCRGTLPTDGGRRGQIEVYWHGRYFVMTGQHLDDSVDEIQDSQEALERLWATQIRPDQRSSEPAEPAEPIVRADFPWSKFDAAMTNDRNFKRTWERKRDSEFKDNSLSSYDIALAIRAVGMEWTDGEIAALIWAFRSKESATDKLTRPDYLPKFVIAKAREMARSGHGDKSADFEVAHEENVREEAKDNTDTARRAVHERLGVDIERFVQVGKDPATYFAVIEGREVRLGNEADLLMQAKIRSRLMSESGVVIHQCKQLRWDTVVRCLLAMREMRSSEDGDFSGRVAGMFEAYLAQRKPIPIDMLDGVTRDKGDVILRREPFIEGGRLFVSAPDIVARIAHLGDFKGAQEVRAWLAMAGYVAGAVVAHHSRLKKSLGRSYWSQPLGARER
jgi:primase-polymerase (primpol)-like protein